MSQLNLFTPPQPPRNGEQFGRIPFADHRVDAANVAEFVRRYQRHDRLGAHGEEYVATVIAWHEAQHQRNGYTIISRHESNTGDVVAWPMLV